MPYKAICFDAAGIERNDFSLTAGIGGVFFNENIGEFQPLGKLIVTRADAGVVLGEADFEIVDTGGTGPVEIVSADDGVDLGSESVIISSGKFHVSFSLEIGVVRHRLSLG